MRHPAAAFKLISSGARSGGRARRRTGPDPRIRNPGVVAFEEAVTESPGEIRQ
jgi:hypothetical protein